MLLRVGLKALALGFRTQGPQGPYGHIWAIIARHL